MATLYFKVSSDYDEVIRLRKECEKLEAQLKKMDVNKSPAAAKALETQLASTRQQMMGLVTEAAKTGAVMENDLKKKLNSASKASDELTEEIIKQKKIIRDTQDDVRRLSDEYSKMGKYSPNSKAKLAELNIAKAALNEQRYSLGELQDQQARNRLEVRKLTREYKEFVSGTNNADEIVKSLTDSLKRTAAEIGGLVAIKKFGSDVIEATGKMQQLQVALSTILQDKSKADQLISDIVQFAAKTPFNLDDVATGAKQLLAYGSSADNVVNELSMLGDVASGLQIPIGQLIYLYGTLRTQGRAMTVDIRQFAGRGIPIYEELAKVLGVSKDQVGELVKEGKVGFKEVEQAFKNMTSEGGKFANLMESSAGTWPQRLSNIEDTLFQKMNEFGNKYKEVFEFGIGTAEDLVENLDDVIAVMGSLIAAYGTYKAALIAAAVAQKAVGFVESIRLIGMYRKEMGLATAAQQAFNLAAKSNVYVALLATLVGVGTAIYMFTKRTNEATAAQETLNSVNKKADEEFSKQAATVDRLSGVLKSETSSLEQKKKALSDLQAIIPSYNASLDEEGKLINNNTEAITAYLTQLEKQIRLKAAQEELEELYRKKRIQEKDYKSSQENFDRVKKENPLGEFYGESGARLQLYTVQERSSAEKKVNKAKEALDETISSINALEKEIEKSSLSDKKEDPQSSISKEIENTSKRIKILKQEIADLRSGKLQAEAGKTVESAISAKEKELQSAQKTLEILTGVKNNGTKSSSPFPKIEQTFAQELEKQADAAEEATTDTINDMVKTMLDGLDAEQEAMYKYLRNYGTFREQQQAITEEYSKKIAEAGGADTWQGKLLGKERDQVLSDLYVKSEDTASAISRLFGDMKDKTLGELQDINLKGSEALEFLKSGEWDEDKGAIFGITKEQFDTLKQSPEALEAISNALNDNRHATDRLRPAYGKVEDGLKKMFDAGDDSKKLKEALTDIRDGLDEIIQLGSFASDVFSNMGDAFGSDMLKGVSDGISVAMDTVNATMTGAQAGSMFGPMGSIVGGAVGFATSLASSIAGMFGADYSEYENMKAQYDTLISVWDTLIGKKTEYIDIDYGVEAQKAADEAARLVGIQIQRQRQLAKMLASSGSSVGSHSLAYRVNDRMNSSDWSNLSVLVGKQVGTLQDVLNLDADVIGKVLQDEHFVSVLTTVNSDFIEYIQNIEKYSEQLGEIAEKEREALTGIGFDAFRDGYLDMLSDLESTNEDFADNFEKNLQNAILSSLVANKYSDRIKSLYEDWAKAGEDGLTSREAEELRREQQQIVEDMLADREQLMEDFGWSSSSEQQSASGRGFGTEMTHEDAGELSGRFTAVYESNLRIEAAEQLQTVAITELRGSISALTAQASGIYNIADETRTILANSYLELQQIRENTGEIVKPIKQMQADIAEVKRNTSRL